MKFILQLVKCILGILPAIALCLATTKINITRSNRGRQFLMPFIALVYCIFAVAFMENINSNILRILEFLPFAKTINWNKGLIYVSNAAIITGFLIIKGIILPVLNLLWGSQKSLVQETTGLFYDYEDEFDKWFLKPKYGQLKIYFKGFFYAALIISSVIFSMSQNLPDKLYFKSVFYPVFGIILLGEVLSFLSGYTKTEFMEDILGEDDESYHVANYGIVKEILNELFKKRVLYENTTDCTNDIATSFDLLDKMQVSNSPDLRLMGQYFSKLKEDREDIDVDSVKSCVNMIQGKSVLFCNPFYRDLTNYIIFPLTKHLIQYNKCLVIVGRDSVADDVKQWIEEGLFRQTNIPSLWKTEILSKNSEECDIGIIKFSDIYNLQLLEAYDSFLRRVKFVILIEPSRILATAQVGLSLIAAKFDQTNGNVVYCSCDRNCDGLVDSISHTLKTSITEVMASVIPTSYCTKMFWNTDGEYMHHKILPNISKYLGVGSELGIVAMKYQLSNVTWMSSDKFPVIDMKWIIGQYYRNLCQYASLPVNQEAIYEIFDFEVNLWNYTRKENSFIILEDEFHNLFDAARIYASRAKNQGFINVLSENYLLRDYMVGNPDIFLTDPKAIPTIVADYARTERNVILKLVMMMSETPVCEDKVSDEFMISGIKCHDPYSILKQLIEKHCGITDFTLNVHFREELIEDGLHSQLKKYYEIEEGSKVYEYARSLKNAYFLAEDEKGEWNYIGAKLYGHVYQTYLPGQYVTISGKYYEIATITPKNGVVVRRAADHIDSRKYYRQIRNVKLLRWIDDENMASKKTISNIGIVKSFCDIRVETNGYYIMSSFNDMKNAKTILLNGIPAREYKNKSIMKIILPNSNDSIRFTICLLLNEIFKTIYPESYQYISTTMYQTQEIASNLKGLVYNLESDNPDDGIYIIEDSEIDLGLIVSVDRNLSRFLEIITDVLTWYETKMLEKPAEEEEEVKETPTKTILEKKTEKKQKLFKRLLRLPMRLLKRKKADMGDEASEVTNTSDIQNEIDETLNSETEIINKPDADGFDSNNGSSSNEGKPAEKDETSDNDHCENSNPADEKPDGSDGEAAVTEETDIAETIEEETEKTAVIEVETENNATIEEESDTATGKGEIDASTNSNDYQTGCYLLFGYEKIDSLMDMKGTINYLSQYGYHENPLQQARDNSNIADQIEKTYDPYKSGSHFCDFCGIELIGGEYDILQDGRERCNHCSSTALRTGDDFKKIYKNVLRNMETFYGIKVNVAIKVRMTNEKKIAQHLGEKFVATPSFDPQTLGFAKKDKDGYSIYILNGTPKLAAIATIAHEITHIWQYINWSDKEMKQLYGEEHLHEVYEGMAKWVEIQYLFYLNEIAYGKRQEIATRLRNDEYGRGFLMYVEKYPLVYESSNKRITPFKEIPPL